MQNVKNEHKNDAVKQENKSFKTEDKFHKDDRNYRDDNYIKMISIIKKMNKNHQEPISI